ncbi:hypothetical protein KKF34_13500 [Myxococcota bacterium]|nr:hypothetical protein [Myxococcota bacterium]MBU1380565.1 hypothetical protein [Myxococcota bacterium]MBU1497885.1 hypothetical protein [Myxococcota bacterium]
MIDLYLIASAAIAFLFIFIGGIFIGRGKGPALLKGEIDTNTKLQKQIKLLETDLEIIKSAGQSIDVVEEKVPEKNVEIEILERELSVKILELEEKQKLINELSSRLLQLEAKKTDIMPAIPEPKDGESYVSKGDEIIKRGFEGFVDALQKESDALREELENAHMTINRMDKEISRLSDDNPPDEDRESLLSKIDFLNEKLQEYALKIAKYEYTLSDKVFQKGRTSEVSKQENAHEFSAAVASLNTEKTEE